MISPTVAIAILIALIGWLATVRAISASQLSRGKKQWLLLPSWIPWLVFALGAPILAGSLSIPTALNLGGAMTVGMAVSIAISQRRPKR